MPITQDRMLAILSEAEALLDAFRATRQNILDFTQRAQRDLSMDKAEALTMLRMTTLAITEPHFHAIYSERRHFNSAHKRNAREASRARANRLNERLLGHTTPRHTSTPKTRGPSGETWKFGTSDEPQANVAQDLNEVFQAQSRANATNAASELNLTGEPTDEQLQADDIFAASLRNRTTS